MIKKGAFLIGIIGLTVSSCIDHEVIPAPIPEVELYAHFEGDIGGVFREYTENVLEYSATPSIAKQTLGGITDAQYLFSMISPTYLDYVQIAMGSISWPDPTGTQTPGLTQFNDFFLANDLPNYSNLAYAGFEVTYRDVYGVTWKSHQDSIPQDVSFTAIKQESDASGDYSKFICSFNTTVHHTYSVVDWSVIPQTIPATMKDSNASITIENAIYHGYFKR